MPISAPGQHSSEKMWQRWQAAGNSEFDWPEQLTASGVLTTWAVVRLSYRTSTAVGKLFTRRVIFEKLLKPRAALTRRTKKRSTHPQMFCFLLKIGGQKRSDSR